MMVLSDAGSTTFICWLFAVYFAFDELFHLLRTLYLLVHCKLHGKPETLDSHELSWFLIFICAVLFLDVSKAGHVPLIPTVVCIGGWLFIPLCVILQKKLASMKSWREYLGDVMERFFCFLENARSFLLFTEQKWGRLIRKVFLIGVLLFAIYICFTESLPNVAFAAALFGVVPFYFAIEFAMHSCKRLLLFWLLHCLLFSCGVSASVYPTRGDTLHAAVAYAFFLILYASLWLFAAGVADDDVAKMAASIVNTGTTILVILINVLVGWGLNCLGEQAHYRNALEQLQYCGNLILLPLIVSGYLSALLKEMQIYRCIRREKREQQKRIQQAREAHTPVQAKAPSEPEPENEMEL